MRTCVRLTGVLLVLAWCRTSNAQTTPEQVIEAFFGPSGIADKANLYTGEMLMYYSDQPTLGEALEPGVRTRIRSLGRSRDLSVFEVTLSAHGAAQDWYAYLVQDEGRWKLEAVRSLAMTGLPALLLQDLARKPQRTPDDEWTFQNLQLLFKSDVDLKRYVHTQLKRLERIAELEMSGKSDEALAVAKTLFVQSVVTTSDGRIELVIGGVLGNSVGFMFVPSGHSEPPMNPHDYIYVERVIGGWYVFKTT